MSRSRNETKDFVTRLSPDYVDSFVLLHCHISISPKIEVHVNPNETKLNSNFNYYNDNPTTRHTVESQLRALINSKIFCLSLSLIFSIGFGNTNANEYQSMTICFCSLKENTHRLCKWIQIKLILIQLCVNTE